MSISALSNKSTISRLSIIILLCAVCCFLSGCKNKDHKPQSEFAVANSYLHAILKDLCGDQQEILSLVPPGMCPGHFDISPSQVDRLCNCKVLFVFDFQHNIENAMPRVKNQGLKVSKIKPLPGLCIPETYLGIAKQIAAVLSEENPTQKERYELRLQEIEKRLEKLSDEIHEKMQQAGLNNTRIITSKHQEEFAKWLGLNPVSTFAGRDIVTPAGINLSLQEASQNEIELVIANQQEGTQLAKSLAEHLKVKLVVFGNFPLCDTNTVSDSFTDLVYENVNNLLEAIQ